MENPSGSAPRIHLLTAVLSVCYEDVSSCIQPRDYNDVIYFNGVKIVKTVMIYIITGIMWIVCDS